MHPNPSAAGYLGESLAPTGRLRIERGASADEPADLVGSSEARHEELLVDPAISRAKFEREISDFQKMSREYLRRGWLMVRAEFPETVVLFAAPHLQPRGVLFGVVVNFTNYDFWAPSVTFVDPFTLEPLLGDQITTPILSRPTPRARGVPINPGALGGDGQVEAPPRDVPVQPGSPVAPGQPLHLLQHMEDKRPFLCIAGVREYHDHPFHSNDPWLAHRGTGVGSLVHILNIIHRHGVAPIQNWNFQVAFNVQLTGVAVDLDRVPG